MMNELTDLCIRPTGNYTRLSISYSHLSKIQNSNPTCNPAFEDRVVKTLTSDDVLALPPFPPVVLDGIVDDLESQSRTMHNFGSGDVEIH